MSWYPSNDCIGWDIFCNYCSRSNHRSLTNGHSLSHGSIGANPDILTNFNGS